MPAVIPLIFQIPAVVTALGATAAGLLTSGSAMVVAIHKARAVEASHARSNGGAIHGEDHSLMGIDPRKRGRPAQFQPGQTL